MPSSTSNPTSAAVPLPAFAGSFSLSGRLVRALDGAPVQGTIELDQTPQSTLGHAEVVTDPEGRFAFTNLPTSVVYKVKAAGCLDRRSTWMISESKSDVSIELICESPRLSLDFYRTFVRNIAETTIGPAFTKPLGQSPRFYVRTVLEDTGAVVDEDVIAGLRRIFEHSVEELSGGRLRMSGFEVGTTQRGPEAGLVRVGFRSFIRNFVAGETVTTSSPTVTLVYDRRFDTEEIKRNNYAANCESVSVAVAEHEAVHVMGFYHTPTTAQDFQTPTCSGQGRPERVRDAARVMYSRPLGNTDPDFDPVNFISPARVSAQSEVRISCAWPEIR